MTAFNPFFINSNICLKQEDICDFDTFMKTIAGNTGNSYITYSLMKELGVDAGQTKHIPSIYTYDFNNLSKDAEIIRENCSHLFLILQDQIRISESYGLQLPYKGIEQLIEKSQKPLVIMGLGANSFTGFDPEFYKQLKPELVNFLKFLSDHTPEIGVRGNFTAEVLNQLGIKNVRVIGCPSFYEMGPGRVVNKAKDIEIKDVLLTHSCPILSLQNNHQICQDFQEENIIKTIAFNEELKIKNVLEINKILQHKYHVFSNMEEWKKCISHFKFAFGDRLHGSICALNAGVPAMCCNGDSRAHEMCEFLHIPHYSNIDANTDVLKLYEQADIDDLNKNYPILFDNFKDFIVKNVGITPFEVKAQVNQPSLLLYASKLKYSKMQFFWKKFKRIFFSIKKGKEYNEVRILFFKFKRKKYRRVNNEIL